MSEKPKSSRAPKHSKRPIAGASPAPAPAAASSSSAVVTSSSTPATHAPKHPPREEKKEKYTTERLALERGERREGRPGAEYRQTEYKRQDVPMTLGVNLTFYVPAEDVQYAWVEQKKWTRVLQVHLATPKADDSAWAPVELAGEARHVFEAARMIIEHVEEVDDCVLYIRLPVERIRQLAGDLGCKSPTVRLIGARCGARIYVPTPHEVDLTVTLEGTMEQVRNGMGLITDPLMHYATRYKKEKFPIPASSIGIVMGQAGKTVLAIAAATATFIDVIGTLHRDAKKKKEHKKALEAAAAAAAAAASAQKKGGEDAGDKNVEKTDKKDDDEHTHNDEDEKEEFGAVSIEGPVDGVMLAKGIIDRMLSAGDRHGDALHFATEKHRDEGWFVPEATDYKFGDAVNPYHVDLPAPPAPPSSTLVTTTTTNSATSGGFGVSSSSVAGVSSSTASAANGAGGVGSSTFHLYGAGLAGGKTGKADSTSAVAKQITPLRAWQTSTEKKGTATVIITTSSSTTAGIGGKKEEAGVGAGGAGSSSSSSTSTSAYKGVSISTGKFGTVTTQHHTAIVAATQPKAAPTAPYADAKITRGGVVVGASGTKSSSSSSYVNSGKGTVGVGSKLTSEEGVTTTTTTTTSSTTTASTNVSLPSSRAVKPISSKIVGKKGSFLSAKPPAVPGAVVPGAETSDETSTTTAPTTFSAVTPTAVTTASPAKSASSPLIRGSRGGRGGSRGGRGAATAARAETTTTSSAGGAAASSTTTENAGASPDGTADSATPSTATSPAGGGRVERGGSSRGGAVRGSPRGRGGGRGGGRGVGSPVSGGPVSGGAAGSDASSSSPPVFTPALQVPA